MNLRPLFSSQICQSNPNSTLIFGALSVWPGSWLVQTLKIQRWTLEPYLEIFDSEFDDNAQCLQCLRLWSGEVMNLTLMPVGRQICLLLSTSLCTFLESTSSLWRFVVAIIGDCGQLSRISGSVAVRTVAMGAATVRHVRHRRVGLCPCPFYVS